MEPNLCFVILSDRFSNFRSYLIDFISSDAANAKCSYDVYCFGKVLLELVTGKLGISSPDNPQNIEYMDHALPYISTTEKELVTKILDPSLMVDEEFLEEVWAMAIIAKSCLNPKPTRRPLMRHIVNALENPFKVIREENSGSGSEHLRTNSSRGSWNAAIFGSLRESASDVTVAHGGGGTCGGGGSGSGSSGRNNNGSSSSRRRQSSEIVPEPEESV